MQIVEYMPERKQDFIDLNTWWIKKYFGEIEQGDWDEFNHIDEEIAKGGMIFFALDDRDGAALATCMAINRGKNEWEIVKLGSHPGRPHKGCGKAVFEACLQWAESHGARRIYMITNSSLKAAIHIYETHGFKRTETSDFGGYARGDYALEKWIESRG